MKRLLQNSSCRAKAVLGLTMTVGLIEHLMIDRALRRICGFSLHMTLPSEATISRAFDEFAEGAWANAHQALFKEHLGDLRTSSPCFTAKSFLSVLGRDDNVSVRMVGKLEGLSPEGLNS